MKRLLIGIAALALSSAPAAEAKGNTQVRVCGEDDCVALAEGPLAAHIVGPAGGVEEPPKAAPFYRLDVTIEAGTETPAFSNVFVPGEDLIAANSGAQRALIWYVPRTEALRLLEAATRNLDPYAAPDAWPPSVDAPDGWTNYAPLGEEGLNWRPWALALGALMIALSAGGLIARRATTA